MFKLLATAMLMMVMLTASIIMMMATWLPMRAMMMGTFTVTVLENTTTLLNTYTAPRTTKSSATTRPHKLVPCIRMSLPIQNNATCLIYIYIYIYIFLFFFFLRVH